MSAFSTASTRCCKSRQISCRPFAQCHVNAGTPGDPSRSARGDPQNPRRARAGQIPSSAQCFRHGLSYYYVAKRVSGLLSASLPLLAQEDP
eukprot:3711212-Pyramimonas_sp.AAC.1